MGWRLEQGPGSSKKSQITIDKITVTGGDRERYFCLSCKECVCFGVFIYPAQGFSLTIGRWYVAGGYASVAAKKESSGGG